MEGKPEEQANTSDTRLLKCWKKGSRAQGWAGAVRRQRRELGRL